MEMTECHLYGNDDTPFLACKIAIKILEPFKIHILGCGSALPTLKHNASSQLIEMRGKCFMVDCGEGAQMQFRRSHIRFS